MSKWLSRLAPRSACRNVGKHCFSTSSKYSTVLDLVLSQSGNVADVYRRIYLIVIESQLHAEIILSIVRCPIHIFQEAHQFLLIQVLTLDNMFGIRTIEVGGHILQSTAPPIATSESLGGELSGKQDMFPMI